MLVTACPNGVADPEQRQRADGDRQAGHFARLEGAEREEEREHRDDREHEQPERLAEDRQDLRPATGHVLIVSSASTTADEPQQDERRDDAAEQRERALEHGL